MAKGGGKKKQKQTTLEPALPLLKKPMEHIGKQIAVKGSFWQGRMTAVEKETLYLCTITDFELLRKFPGQEIKSAGYALKEMGVTGTGSLEQGDASGDLFWMPYPDPFLKYYYDTFPKELPEKTSAAHKQAVVGDLTGGSGSEEESGGCGEPPKPDVHPSFPHLRLSTTAPVVNYFTINSDKLIEMGKHSGSFTAQFECLVEEGDGRTCCAKRRITHGRGKAVSTTNLIQHIREKAEGGCGAHKAALAVIQAASSNFINLDGQQVQVFNFSEAFEHHERLMWLRTVGLSYKMTTRDEFRDYVRGFEPKAAFPDKSTIHRLAVTAKELQKEQRLIRIATLKRTYKGKMCVGIQLDMWTDTDTHTAFAAVIMTSLEDPSSVADSLYLCTELLDFAVFPFTSKTGENIKAWFLQVLLDNGIDHSIIAGITPDGAADGHCGLSMIETLAEKVDTCDLHLLQRAVLFAVGLAGSKSKNPDAKASLKKHNRVAMLSRQSLAYGKTIKEAQIAAGVMEHSVLALVGTATTRWGNQFLQVERDCTLRLAIDPALDKFKRDNKGNKEALVESNESDQGSKVGAAVAASELGLSDDDWEEAQELEGFLSYPYQHSTGTRTDANP